MSDMSELREYRMRSKEGKRVSLVEFYRELHGRRQRRGQGAGGTIGQLCNKKWLMQGEFPGGGLVNIA